MGLPSLIPTIRASYARQMKKLSKFRNPFCIVPLFKKIDANNDNKISRDAFIGHMKLSKSIDLGLWDALFDALDVNKTLEFFLFLSLGPRKPSKTRQISWKLLIGLR